MSQTINMTTLVDILKEAVTGWSRHSDELRHLDAIIGDGDMGVTVEVGSKAVADYLESLPPKPAKAFASLDTTEIAKLRSGPALTPSQVFAVRAALAAAGKIP